MQLPDIRARVMMALAILSLACGSSEREPEATAKTGSDAMAGMPGMAPPDSGAKTATTVSLTAAQVAHGEVQWVTATMGTTTGSVTVPGEVVPNEDHTARLGAPARGRVLAVHVAQGDRVRRGDRLVTLQSVEASATLSDVAKAEAQLSSQRAQASYASSARARAERLLALSAIPRQEYERAVADDGLAQAMLQQAESELRRAREAAQAMGVDADAPGSIVIRSSLDGVVLIRSAMPGTVVDAGAPLMVVTDPATLWVTASAPEGLTGVLRRGARVRFTVPAFPADTFPGRLEAVGPGLDPATRTLPLRAITPNRAGRLRPEMLATLTLDGAGTVAAVLLPDDAIQLMDGRSVVFLAVPDAQGGARFTLRQVAVASRQGGTVAITSGLSAGDVVVMKGAFAVKSQLQKGRIPAMEM